MRIGRRFQEEMDTIQMAPLIDVIFLTLIFFMVTSVYGTLESKVEITLPTADSAIQTERGPGEIYINLRADGSIVVNDREMDVLELQQVLYRVAAHFPGGAVTIRADRAALLGNAIAVLDCCRKADIQNISFAAIKEAPATPAVPDASQARN